MGNEPRPAGPDQQAESVIETFQRYLMAVSERLLLAGFDEPEVIDQYEVERARFMAGGAYRTDTQPVSVLHQRLQEAVSDGWLPAIVAAALSAEIERLSHQRAKLS